jgi:hypothetical protein
MGSVHGNNNDFASKDSGVNISYIETIYGAAGGGNNPPDINGDGDFNLEDFDYIARHWFMPCSDPNWCQGADLDLSGLVDYQDLKTFTQNWDGLP